MNDYERGYEQFRKMVGDDRIGPLIDRFKSVCPDFEREVIAVVGATGAQGGGLRLSPLFSGYSLSR